MSFRDRFRQHASDFFWTCAVIFMMALSLWFFGSAFVSLATLLLVVLIAIAPLLCILIPVFLLYVVLRGITDFLRR